MSAREPAPSRLVVEPDCQGLRADAFLALSLPRLSRRRIRQKVQTGEAFLNGRRFASSARLCAGDIIMVSWRSVPAAGPCRAFEILYEDEHLVAVDKPAGAASHPTGRFQSDTVIQFLRERLAAETRASLAQAGDFYPSLVNRLDLLTSGVILAAKTGGALRPMLALAAGGGLQKTYIALVEGVVASEEGRIELPLGPDPAGRVSIKMTVRPDGLACFTDYRVLSRLARHTLLAVFPRTGRQHQVRAHLAALGHPVYGDLLYRDEELFLSALQGAEPPDRDAWGTGTELSPRHCLHAMETGFTHPFTGQKVVIRSALPSDFRDLLAGCGGAWTAQMLTSFQRPRDASRSP